MPNKFGVECITRAGAWPFLHASWSCFEEPCGRAFFTACVTSRPCAFNLLVVLQFGFRHDRRHAHILTLQGFDHHVSGSVHQFFCACSQQSSLASLSSRSSLGCAKGLQPFCTQIVLAVHLRLATLWQSLIMSMCHMRTEPRLV